MRDAVASRSAAPQGRGDPSMTTAQEGRLTLKFVLSGLGIATGIVHIVAEATSGGDAEHKGES